MIRYTAPMDNDTLRVIAAAALGPVVGMVVYGLRDQYMAKHAERIERRRQARRAWMHAAGLRAGRRVRRLFH